MQGAPPNPLGTREQSCIHRRVFVNMSKQCEQGVMCYYCIMPLLLFQIIECALFSQAH